MLKFALLALAAICGFVASARAANIPELELAPFVDNEDARLTVPEIIAKYGYPIEIHEITTADGYILQAHRIPYGKAPGAGPAENKPVAWLQHGLMGDSSNYIMNNEDKALAYVLANLGYDVWMGNARGNTYSRKHVSFSNTSSEFWDFSWHQMGVYDVPAVIDYALEVTGQEQLYWVGHSMGTTMFWIAMAERPEYNAKIRLMSALAPVAFMEHMVSPMRLLAPIANSLDTILNLLGYNELLPSSPLTDFLGQTVCHENSPIHFVCSNVLFLIAGYNSDQYNRTLLPIVLGHSPAGSSSRAIVHYAQGINSGLFRQFNHGKVKNLELYGQETPPEYDLSKITAPVAFYWGENDWLAGTADVYRLAEALPNLVRKFRIRHDKFNHMDFLWAIDNDELTVEPVVEFLQYF